MLELPAETHAKIQELCADGDARAKSKQWSDALRLYWLAWDLLPEPRTDWEAATWILAAVGDANFLSGDYAAGRANLEKAMHCPGAIGNPFLHMRLGQCQFELADSDRAADELMRAYMGAGTDIFDREDPKYLTFLAERAEGVPKPKPGRRFWN